MQDIRYLDIGCWNGARTSEFTRNLSQFFKNVETYGIDLNEEVLEKAKNGNITVFKLDVEKESIPIKADIITCFEIIEHIYDCDYFIYNLYSSLNPNGLLLISTPNTVSWKNRIAMLFGIPPLNMEVSLIKYFGLKNLNKYYQKYAPAGHIRGFTSLSLKEMLEHYGLHVIDVEGLENWNVTRFLDTTPSLATNFLIMARRV